MIAKVIFIFLFIYLISVLPGTVDYFTYTKAVSIRQIWWEETMERPGKAHEHPQFPKLESFFDQIKTFLQRPLIYLYIGKIFKGWRKAFQSGGMFK